MLATFCSSLRCQTSWRRDIEVDLDTDSGRFPNSSLFFVLCLIFLGSGLLGVEKVMDPD